jgi:hypothetical protein
MRGDVRADAGGVVAEPVRVRRLTDEAAICASPRPATGKPPHHSGSLNRTSSVGQQAPLAAANRIINLRGQQCRQ